jgi:hypothetical protein
MNFLSTLRLSTARACLAFACASSICALALQAQRFPASSWVLQEVTRRKLGYAGIAIDIDSPLLTAEPWRCKMSAVSGLRGATFGDKLGQISPTSLRHFYAFGVLELVATSDPLTCDVRVNRSVVDSVVRVASTDRTAAVRVRGASGSRTLEATLQEPRGWKVLEIVQGSQPGFFRAKVAYEISTSRFVELLRVRNRMSPVLCPLALPEPGVIVDSVAIQRNGQGFQIVPNMLATYSAPDRERIKQNDLFWFRSRDEGSDCPS